MVVARRAIKYIADIHISIAPSYLRSEKILHEYQSFFISKQLDF